VKIETSGTWRYVYIKSIFLKICVVFGWVGLGMEYGWLDGGWMPMWIVEEGSSIVDTLT
jgi:hypothetical protein